MGIVRSGTSIIQVLLLAKICNHSRNKAVCFPAQIEIFTYSENSNRTNNPRKDSNIFVVLSFTSYGKMKLFTVALILCLQAGSLLGVAAPEFFSDDAIADYFNVNQLKSNGAKVSDGVLHLPNHRSGAAEIVIANLLQEALKMYDLRFIQGVSGYWTFHIWLARKNSGSAFHSYAKSLPTGIQTIKRRLSANLMASNVASWSDVAEKKVIVY